MLCGWFAQTDYPAILKRKRGRQQGPTDVNWSIVKEKMRTSNECEPWLRLTSWHAVSTVHSLRHKKSVTLKIIPRTETRILQILFNQLMDLNACFMSMCTLYIRKRRFYVQTGCFCAKNHRVLFACPHRPQFWSSLFASFWSIQDRETMSTKKKPNLTTEQVNAIIG